MSFQTHAASRRVRLELVGAGGEPVDLWRTVMSHGVASLPPARIDEEARTFEYVLPHGWFRLTDGGGTVAVRGRDVVPVVRHMLRLDEDLSQFYALIADDPDLGWATRGAGRMLRSPSVFEDVVKTICTTNCAWSGTVRMVGALVEHLGGGAFPSPATMADADESFYRDIARAGYRGAYLRSLAASVASGELDLEELNDPELPDETVVARLLALPGVGPYASAHMMMLLGRYSLLILDAWTRPKYARLTGRRAVSDRAIERRFRRYGRYAGLAFWLYLTRDWVADGAPARP
jgi:3-methyladenine DNA glycosylase/8-oxoguanine DNA glycosylase